MFARLIAKAILAAIAIAMAFFGIGLLGMALAHALVAALGVAGAYADRRRGAAGCRRCSGRSVMALVAPAQTHRPPTTN